MKKEKTQDSEDGENQASRRGNPLLPTYDCGGALFIKFSIKREAINVVYKHNPIHSSPVNNERYVQSLHALRRQIFLANVRARARLPGTITKCNSNLPPLAVENDPDSRAPKPRAANKTKERKRKRSKKDHVEVENGYTDPDLDMSTSPEAPKASTKKVRRKNALVASPESSRKSGTKKSKNGKEPLSPSTARNKVQIREPSPPARLMKGKACIRCREKKIKCNEAKPACNQCRRGLWTCQYELPSAKKRSKNGCINCKSRKRKCTEERPSCAHCLRIDDDCEYADYS